MSKVKIRICMLHFNEDKPQVLASYDVDTVPMFLNLIYLDSQFVSVIWEIIIFSLSKNFLFAICRIFALQNGGEVYLGNARFFDQVARSWHRYDIWSFDSDQWDACSIKEVSLDNSWCKQLFSFAFRRRNHALFCCRLRNLIGKTQD